MTTPRELRLPALEVRQNAARSFYAFAVDGKQVPRFAAVSRIQREDDGKLKGYQRPEVLAHIQEIRNYIESNAPLLPNAVVIAFDGRVRFDPMRSPPEAPDYARMGTLVIPVTDGEAEAAKPGFIVDGQQRLAAIRDCFDTLDPSAGKTCSFDVTVGIGSAPVQIRGSFTVIGTCVSTGCPPCKWGLKRHCFTASRAASARIAGPPSTLRL